jgi:hypothetical protein
MANNWQVATTPFTRLSESLSISMKSFVQSKKRHLRIVDRAPDRADVIASRGFRQRRDRHLHTAAVLFRQAVAVVVDGLLDRISSSPCS